MNEDFITNGLEADRYLKADKLVHQFKQEIQQEIQSVCNEIKESHEDLFDADASLKPRAFGADANQTLATIRTEFPMNRENEDGATPKLNIAVEWVEPEQQGEENADEGSLCYVLYKIQHGSESRFDAVKRRTESQDKWDELRFGEDQWYHYAKHAPGIVYIPVNDGLEITKGLQMLKKHFSEEYAPELLS